MTAGQLAQKATDLRAEVVEMVYRCKAGHIGGDLSVMDILISLYYRHMNVSPSSMDDPNRDRFILSKGHSVEALYAVLADKGFFPKSDLETMGRPGSPYIGHPSNKINGIEVCSGSLGHGLPVGVGMALAAKMDGAPYCVYVVMGDGELAEGSVWEGAMAGGHYKLDNLTAFVDRNRLQISGPTETVMSQDEQGQRWNAFGWNVLEADGNDIASLDKAISSAKEHRRQPTVIICNTVKGCGVSFMENKAEWHHKVPSTEEYQLALAELRNRRVAL